MRTSVKQALIIAGAWTLLAAGTVFAQVSGVGCALINGQSNPVDAAGDTYGDFFPPGSTLTFTLSNAGGTATAATWSIVGDASGVPVYAGPAGINQSLSFTVPAGSPLPVGYYVTAVNGTATMGIACSAGVVQAVPATSPAVTMLMAALLAVLAFAALRTLGARRR